MPRLYIDQALAASDELRLPDAAVRHAQVLRLQPGDALTLFDGRGGEWSATVLRMGRSEVAVQVLAHEAVERELPLHITLALGMPANERMDGLVEKATELGVAAIQPLMCERSVLRLSGERARKRCAHWQAIATSASEQCGRTRVPRIEPVCTLPEWLPSLGAAGADSARWLLAFDEATPIATQPRPPARLLVLSGPEGGLSAAEEAAAKRAGFAAVSLGQRVLRADTAPLAVLAYLGLG
ncbi:MAG: 16S rRNA (uracil(1498)-N(3))-methyltransferase [Betaproteobacteria bacterium]|nr:MAG: 16S rRNA (uracil(1498)-N(3))-methyltransferase [Betaproteobacteria bacterium]